jgi:hypothetical protein
VLAATILWKLLFAGNSVRQETVMSEMSRNARRAMRAKIHRLTSANHGKVDASDYGPEQVLDSEAKTGMRPVSRRAYKKGGKVVAVGGADAKQNAGKAPRAGKKHLTVDALVNRNYKDANEAREGKKHIGALKTGGRAMKKGGGGIPDIYTSSRPTDDSGRPISDKELNLAPGGGETTPAPKPKPTPAPVKRSGPSPKTVSETAAYMRNVRKSGGRAWEGSAKDEAQDKKLAKKYGMSMSAWEKSKMDKKHDTQHSAKGLKRGGFTSLDGEMQTQEKVSGRIAKRDGGSLAGLEMNSGGRAKKKKSGTNINIVIATGKGQPQMDPNAQQAPAPQGVPVQMPPPPQPQAGAPMPMPAPMPPAGGPGAGPVPMPRKAGGRTYRSYKDMDAGAGSGLGRLEKTEIQKHKK